MLESDKKKETGIGCLELPPPMTEVMTVKRVVIDVTSKRSATRGKAM